MALDYRIAYSRQNMMREANAFRELEFQRRYDPVELHRRLSRQLTLLGYTIAEENIGVMRRTVGEHVGDVLGILFGIIEEDFAAGGTVVYGVLSSQQYYRVRVETIIKIAIQGEVYSEMEAGKALLRSNLEVLISGSARAYETIEQRVAQRAKSKALMPHAKQSYDKAWAKVHGDAASLADFVRSLP